MRTHLLNALKVSALAVVLSFGLSYAIAWIGPTATPPASNAEEPINVSGTAQTKLGTFTVGTITVIGTISATGDTCTSVTGTAKCLSNLNPAILGGFLVYAIHTFKDCTTLGGALYSIGGGKNVCDIPSALPSGWTQYPNWSATQNVYCVDSAPSPEPYGWTSGPTTYPCNTGSHTFSNTPTESCTSTSDGFTYDPGCDCYAPVTTSTTCYATITRVRTY
ncbi:MAG: hypothetical protein HZB11_00755 [Candidatus Yonathbacteria bacterium]|nr:hypothetical protein [Candidatus Yonathbacteria bacterium]